MRYAILLLCSTLFLLMSCNNRKQPKTIETETKITALENHSSKLLTETELNAKDLNQLRLLRNEVYARKGYVFDSAELNTYFNAQPWYSPIKNDTIFLTEMAKQYVHLIKQIEKAKRTETIIYKASHSPSESNRFRDTIAINYKDNKKLLDVLQLFPKSNMGSWDWSQKDRTTMVDYIKTHNYIVDTTAQFLNIKYVKPNTMGLSVVDGFWTLSLYTLDADNTLVITNDSVGDGNDYTVYLLKNAVLQLIDATSIFGDYFNVLLQNNSEACQNLLEENKITFDYDFSAPQSITIASWALHQDEDSDCFKGNTIVLQLNKKEGRFLVSDTYWKEND